MINCYNKDLALDYNTIEIIQKEYLENELPWILGFSGGKDSTALLILCYIALSNIRKKHKQLKVVYCDTGVEIPIVSNLVRDTFAELSKEAKENNIPISTKIVIPPIKDRFFSKVIGRGYPPPTNIFRWCTDRLRVKPLKSVLKESKSEAVILLGVRKGESIERDRTISRHGTQSEYYLKQSNNNNIRIFSPIIKYKVEDVWSTILKNEQPISIKRKKLKQIYEIVGENDSKGNVSLNKLKSKGRFGCWTCTVVRKDKAVERLIKNGFTELEPLFKFRNWLMKIRDDNNYRCQRRRNGTKGLGPFTLEAREEILRKLLEAQSNSPFILISEEEISYIKKNWDKDMKSDKYFEK